MKIVHITTVHPSTDTRIFEKECKTLAAIGNEVTLVVPCPYNEVRHGVKIAGIRKYKWRLLRTVLTTSQAFWSGLKLKGDVYHLHDPELMPFAIFLRLLGKKVIFDMHENLPKAILTKIWIPVYMRKPLSIMFRGMQRIILPFVTIVFAEKSYAVDFQWIKDAVVILNYPRLSLFTNIVSEKYSTPTVGYIGGVNEQRGIFVILEAVKMLREKNIRVDVECVGPLEELPTNHLYVCAIRDGWARFPGRLMPIEGWQRIARCHVGIVTLQPLPNYIDSYPTKLFEYMAMGLPVIASDFPLWREVVGETNCGLLVNPLDQKAIAEAIEWILDHPKEAEAMGRRGRKVVEHIYNWDTEASKLLNLYNKLIAS